MVLLNTTHDISDVKINNVRGVPHSLNLPRLYLHEESLETPAHDDSPPVLKSARVVINLKIYATAERVAKKVYSKYKLFTEKILLKSAANIFFRDILINENIDITFVKALT